jgi:hypothetical protein
MEDQPELARRLGTTDAVVMGVFAIGIAGRLISRR